MLRLFTRQIKELLSTIKSFIKDNNLELSENFHKILNYHSYTIDELQKEIIIIDNRSVLSDIIYQSNSLVLEIRDKYPNYPNLDEFIMKYYKMWIDIIKKIIDSDM